MDYFISAGEPSGDLLAAELVTEIASSHPEWRPFGIVGDKMLSAGVEALTTIEELSVMGFVEVIKHLPHLKLLEGELIAAIERRRPQVAILVDYPGFHLRMAESLRLRGVKVVQYVAPQLWAWGEKRTSRLKRVTDLVLGIMPFEEEFFLKRGVNYRYVGTPQVDRVRSHHGSREQFRLAADARYIGFFPGSRFGEVTRVLPKMIAVRDKLRGEGFQFTVSVAPALKLAAFASLLEGQDIDRLQVTLEQTGSVYLGDTVLIKGRSLELMQVVDAALVTSGTATLECALSKTPMAVAYVMNQLSYRLAKRLVRLPHISLVNLVAGKGLIREFIQDFSTEELAQELRLLASDGHARQEMIAELELLFDCLKGDLAKHATLEISQLLAAPCV